MKPGTEQKGVEIILRILAAIQFLFRTPARFGMLLSISHIYKNFSDLKYY